MVNLNDIARRHLMEYMIRHEASFKYLSEILNVPVEKVSLWASGSHDFSMNEISLIESGLQIRIIEPSEVELSKHEKTAEDLSLIIDHSIQDLSIRSQNVLRKLRSEFQNPYKMLEKLNEAIEGKYNLPMAGKKTLSELNDYAYYLKESPPIFEIKENVNVDHLSFLIKKYKLPHSITLRISNQIERNRPSIFALLSDIISHSPLYNKNLKEVFRIYTDPGNDQKEMSFSNVADLLNISRERIRQLKIKADEEIIGLGTNFKNIFEPTSIHKQYPMLFQSSYIILDNKLSSELNFNESVKLSIKTKALLLKGILCPEVELLNFKSNSIYIVPAKWTTLFKFQKLEEKVKTISKLSIWDRQEYFWDRIYADMILDNNNSSVPEILKFVNYLLTLEFGFKSVPNDEIPEMKPSHLTLLEKIYLAISHYNEPVKIEKIISFINSEFPKTKFTRSSIHASLIRSQLIMTFGKSGTYGLKEWEGKRQDIKSGSIADLVFQYLESSTKPIHIYEIHSYISQFRNTTKNSILSIMSLDTRHRFELFGNSFFGITGKNYDVEDTTSNPISNKTLHEIKRILSANGPISDIKVEQHIIKMYGLTSSQANHFINEAVNSGRLKLLEGKVYLPSWIQDGLRNES